MFVFHHDFVYTLIYLFIYLGDLERLNMQLQESENEKESLKERIDLLHRSQQEWEQKSTTMQLTVSKIVLYFECRMSNSVYLRK